MKKPHMKTNYNGIMNDTNKMFLKYVAQNIIGNIGMTAYYLIDVYFISVSTGTDGIAALGLTFPLYGLIWSIGALISMGFSTRYGIDIDSEEKNYYFSNAVIFCFIFSLPFVFAGICFPETILRLMGGDNHTIPIGIGYTKVLLCLSPVFMLGNTFSSFIRNDSNPTLAMFSTFVSSIINIIGDYILMFPLHLGLTGAGIATSISPIVSIFISSFHFFTENSQLTFKLKKLRTRIYISCLQLGLPSFINEIANSVTSFVLNYLILKHAGNIGVASFGIIVNISNIASSVFTGISQGSQPLLSNAYGRKQYNKVAHLKRLCLLTSFLSAAVMVALIVLFADPMVSIFNSDYDKLLQTITVNGTHIYFYAFLFSSQNIAMSGYLNSIEEPDISFLITLMRGVVFIVIFSFLLSHYFGINGILWSFCASEFSTLCISAILIRHRMIGKST